MKSVQLSEIIGNARMWRKTCRYSKRVLLPPSLILDHATVEEEGRKEGGKRGAKKGRDREGHSSSCATTVSKRVCVCVSMSRRMVWIGQRGRACPHR